MAEKARNKLSVNDKVWIWVNGTHCDDDDEFTPKWLQGRVFDVYHFPLDCWYEENNERYLKHRKEQGEVVQDMFQEQKDLWITQLVEHGISMVHVEYTYLKNGKPTRGSKVVPAK